MIDILIKEIFLRSGRAGVWIRSCDFRVIDVVFLNYVLEGFLMSLKLRLEEFDIFNVKFGDCFFLLCSLKS